MRLPASLRNKHLGLVLGVLAVIGVYYGLSRLIPHENLQGLLEDVSNALGAWTYLLVGLLAFLETGAFVGLVVPGETVMLIGGAVAGQGAVDIYLLIAIGWFAAWLGDTTSFYVGRRLGRGFVMRHGPRVGISEQRFARVEDYFQRHGGKTILIGRFVSLVRALAPFVAGSSGMRYRAFVPYSILGTGIWASAHILIGYIFSRSIDSAAEYAGRGAFILGTLIVVTVATVVAFRFLRVAENRRQAVEWMEQRRLTAWLPPLGRRLQPQARFVWNRLTPGGSFGLEFTSTLAALAVGLFVLIAYTVIVGGDPGPTPGRRHRPGRRRLDPRALADQPGQGGDHPRLTGARLDAGLRLRRRAGAGPSLVGALHPGRRDGTCDRRRARDQGHRRPTPPRWRAGVGARVFLPQRPRRLLDLLRLARGDRGHATAPPEWRAARASSSAESVWLPRSGSRASISGSTTSAMSAPAGPSAPRASRSAPRSR